MPTVLDRLHPDLSSSNVSVGGAASTTSDAAYIDAIENKYAELVLRSAAIPLRLKEYIAGLMAPYQTPDHFTGNRRVVSVESFMQRPVVDVAMMATFDRLDQIARLGPNWDSYGGAPLSRIALATVRHLVSTIRDQYAPIAGPRSVPYTVAPASDGGIQAEWRGAHADLEVEISPGGEMTYLVVNRSGVEPQYREGHTTWGEVSALVGEVITLGR